MMLSVVSPVYGCAEALPELCRRLHETFGGLGCDYEIILVCDRSPDESWALITQEALKSSRVKGILLSRNFGQHCAITAGLARCAGDWVVVMDCDLQDQPEEIPKLIAKADAGYDIVLGKRKLRRDSVFRRLCSRLFYHLLGYLTGTEQDATVANFGIYRSKVIQAVLSMGDEIRYFPAMIQWVGFRRVTVPLAHAERRHGKSSYRLKSMSRLAVNTIIGFSDVPLRITVRLGFTLSLISGAIAGFYFVRYLRGGITVSGFTTLVLSLWFIAGVLLFTMGVIGTYLGKVFDQVKERPLFIVDETLNCEDSHE